MNFLFWTLLVLFMIVCCLMVLLVLIQKGRGGGLSGAFGGGGGNTAFGSKTGDVLTWTTSVFFGIFLLLAIGVNLAANYRQAKADKLAQATVLSNPPPATPGTSAPGTPAPGTPAPGTSAPATPAPPAAPGQP